MSRHAGKVEYGCEQLAGNAAWLHQAQFPTCTGVHSYPCSVGGTEHWHIGHDKRGGGTNCKAVVLPPKYRPARRTGWRVHPSRRSLGDRQRAG